MRPRKKQREHNMDLIFLFFYFFLLSIIGDRKPRLEKVNLGYCEKLQARVKV